MCGRAGSLGRADEPHGALCRRRTYARSDGGRRTDHGGLPAGHQLPGRGVRPRPARSGHALSRDRTRPAGSARAQQRGSAAGARQAGLVRPVAVRVAPDGHRSPRRGRGLVHGRRGGIEQLVTVDRARGSGVPWRTLYEDGGRTSGQIRSSSWPVGRRAVPAAGDERVQVERPQPRSGEDDDLDARGTGGTMGAPRNRKGDRRAAGVAGPHGREPRSSLYRRLEGADQVGWEGLRSGGASHSGALYEARDCAAPAGAKGWLVDSMCQIASARRRARSTWATLGPRWRPSRVLVRR